MEFDPMDRRNFMGVAGGALLCVIGGQEVRLDRQANMKKLAAGVPVPPKVAAAEDNPQFIMASLSGNRREYWITAEPRQWNIAPNKVDEMLNQKIKKRRSTFTAYTYRQYSANFGQPLGPGTIPGPTIEAEVGDTVVVHFRNLCPVPVTMHPHGIFYSNEMDGAYKGRYTDPGGFVQRGRTFTYVWECQPGTAGSWFYHDHGPLDPLPLYKGLFGHMIIREAGETPPDKEFFVSFHSFSPPATGLRDTFQCVNGKAFTGNTPTYNMRLGDDVQMHVLGIDNNFHTFHLHGHRWTEPGGNVVDNKTFGPGDSFPVRFTADNPGRWFYHCHVFTHLHDGMSGWYLVE